MKSLIVLAVTLAVAHCQLRGFQNQAFKPKLPYTPFAAPAAAFTGFAAPAAAAPAFAKTVRSGVSDRDASTLRFSNDISPDGSFNYFFETDNGIAAQEEGSPKQFAGNPPVAPDVARGSFSWTAPDGQVVAINYVADENGYQPSGSALPTPPPIPEAILRSLEYIAKNPSKN